jgi:hypothetical protein
MLEGAVITAAITEDAIYNLVEKIIQYHSATIYLKYHFIYLDFRELSEYLQE